MSKSKANKHEKTLIAVCVAIQASFWVAAGGKIGCEVAQDAGVTQISEHSVCDTLDNIYKDHVVESLESYLESYRVI